MQLIQVPTKLAPGTASQCHNANTIDYLLFLLCSIYKTLIIIKSQQYSGIFRSVKFAERKLILQISEKSWWKRVGLRDLLAGILQLISFLSINLWKQFFSAYFTDMWVMAFFWFDKHFVTLHKNIGTGNTRNLLQ